MPEQHPERSEVAFDDRLVRGRLTIASCCGEVGAATDENVSDGRLPVNAGVQKRLVHLLRRGALAIQEPFHLFSAA